MESESFGVLNIKKEDQGSVVLKLRILDKLLSYKVIDFNDAIWGDLSVGLRNCFLSSDEEVFMKCLRIHHKFILFYGTCCKGYLNLLKGTVVLLKSRHFEINKKRVLIALKLIIENLNSVIVQLLHSSHLAIDEIITTFVDVVTFTTVLKLLGTLDEDSNWLRLICYGTYIRNCYFTTLKDKHGDFLRNMTTIFLQSLNSEENCICFGRFLFNFWNYTSNLNNLQDEFSHQHVLEQTIIKIHHKKKPELKLLLIDLFKKNPLVVTPKLLDLIVQPLSHHKSYNNLHSFENDVYIFQIISDLAKSSNYHILFGIPYNSRKAKFPFLKNSTNLPQRIIDLAGVTLNSLLNEELNKETVVAVSHILTCCISLYENHFSFHNTAKFLPILEEFYKNFGPDSAEISVCISALMKLFYTNFNSFEFNSDIFTDLLSVYSCDDLKTVITRSGNSSNGWNCLKNNKNQIIKPYLERIWSSDDIYEDASLPTLIFFLNILRTNSLTTTALLSEEDEDKTVVEGDKPTVLNELLERTLNEEGGEEEQYLGLLIMKVFIANLDLVLHLQANYRMQERLTLLSRENEIIDAPSSVRKQVLRSLEEIGLVVSHLEEEKLALITISAAGNEFKNFLLEESKNNDASWLNHARVAFKSSLNSFDPTILPILLEKIPKTVVYRKSELRWPPAGSVCYQLHPEDFAGISVIVNFGIRMNFLSRESREHHEENLITLIKQTRLFLGHQPEHFFSFDWFLGIIFLCCCGDFEQTKQSLVYFTETPVTALVWNTFGKEFDEHLIKHFYQHLELVLEENCMSYEASKSLGFLPDLFVQSWLAQCFFNSLRIEEICSFLAFSVLYPVECVLYYMVAIFEHLSGQICQLTHTFNIETITNMSDLAEFRLSNYIDIIENLIKHNRNTHKL